MKIVLATFGSRGDVQPMLALSLALKRAGHDVLLAAPPEKADWAAELGCPFYPLGGDITSFIDSMKDAYSIGSVFKFMGYLRKELPSQFDILTGIISGADLVIGSSLMFFLSSAAELLSIKYCYVAFVPQLFPSGHHPFIAFKRQGLPGWYNRMTWHIALVLDRFNLTGLINKKRVQVGLKPVRDAWFHIMGPRVILACDRLIAWPPSDILPAVIQTGYMHLEQPS